MQWPVGQRVARWVRQRAVQQIPNRVSGVRGVMAHARGFMLRHIPGMVTCREFEDLILDYLEGELGERQKLAFELHLKMCRECREYLEAYRLTVELASNALHEPDAELPDDVPEGLVEAILEARNHCARKNR